MDFCALTLTKVTDVLTHFIVQLTKSVSSLERCWCVGMVQSLRRVCCYIGFCMLSVCMSTGHVWSHCHHRSFHETGTWATPELIFWMWAVRGIKIRCIYILLLLRLLWMLIIWYVVVVVVVVVMYFCCTSCLLQDCQRFVVTYFPTPRHKHNSALREHNVPHSPLQ